ncbi:MAG: lipoyl(octanoyl) transferase LipB [Planctomycetota bacterium]
MHPEVEDLGRAPYEPVLARMRDLAAAIHRGDERGRILLVEHEPVYTAGRATPQAELGPGIVAIERGGKITYHGPGQLVVYPILPLPSRDLHAWLRRLEAFGVAFAAQFGVAATPSVDGTGVFAGRRKFASIGVAVKHWINLHGIALNIDMPSEPWQAVRPCGLSPDVMTDLSTAAGRPIAMDEARAAARATVLLLAGPEDAL